MKNKRLTALGAYIFAGGFTVGVRRHFDVLAHLEDGPYGVATALWNKLVPEVFQDPDAWPVERFRGKVGFLFANPPCAPWSSCSHGRACHWTDDPRVNAVKRTYALLESIEPEAWAWESVRPTWVRGRELVETVAKKAMARGYSATVLMVNGIHHGVPQVRKRFFLVLHKRLIDWEPGSERIVTVREAFSKPFKTETVSPCAPQYLKLLKKAKPGERLAKVFNRLNAEAVAHRAEGERVKGRPSFQNLRLVADEPSCVLTGGAKQFHPFDDRLISVEESAALCGYPRNFEFVGGTSKQYAQVAQAVMPPVGEYLARMVRGSLESGRRIKKPFFERVEIFGDRVDRELLAAPTGSMSLEIKEPPPFDPDPPKLKVGSNIGVETRMGRDPRPPKKSGSGYRIRQMLVAGKSTDQILATIRKEFPQSKAKASDVYWNKRKLQSQGGIP